MHLLLWLVISNQVFRRGFNGLNVRISSFSELPWYPATLEITYLIDKFFDVTKTLSDKEFIEEGVLHLSGETL